MLARIRFLMVAVFAALLAYEFVIWPQDVVCAQTPPRVEITFKNESSQTVRVYVWNCKAETWVTFGGKDKVWWFEIGKGQKETRNLPAAGKYKFWLQNKSGVMHAQETYEIAAGTPFKQELTDDEVTMTEVVVSATGKREQIQVTNRVPQFRSTRDALRRLRYKD